MKSFVAFRALIELLEETNQTHLLDETLLRCYEQEKLPIEEMTNQVIPLYDRFTYDEVSAKIAEIVTPEGTKPKIEVVFQTLEGLREACPNHTGDWYFSGRYPTPGGNRVVNRAFINYMEKSNVRAY
jgi:amidophosphoribosyltransferase